MNSVHLNFNIFKQKTIEFHSQSAFTSPVSSVCSSVSLSSSPSPSPLIATADRVDIFQIPWEKLPEALMQCLETSPSSKLRRELIQIVVSEMMHASFSPGKQASTEGVQKMIAMYPLPLQDVIEGGLVGMGCR